MPDDFRYILALQEGAAIGMADGYAQATGRPALVNLHAAAGTGNAMGNLVNTQAGHVPVIVTSGQQARQYTELKAYLTNVDAPRLVEPLVKWSHEPARPQDAPQSLSNAILQAAAAPSGPVYLSLPLDDWDKDADASALAHLKSRGIDGNPVVPEEALGRLSERLAAAKNPVMVAGPDIDTPTTGGFFPGASPPSPAASRGMTSSSSSAPRSSCTTSSPPAITCPRAPNCGR
jgi:benzoylformate decarboxylase